MKRICIKCGNEFDTPLGYSDKTLCDDCAQESKDNRVIRPRTCVDCGTIFMGYPRSQRCEPCHKERDKKREKEFRQRKAAGKTRPIGSIDYCVKCGAEYTVMAGLQRYCPKCAPEEIKKNDRAKSIEWNREHNRIAIVKSEREKSVAEIPCVICGKMFKPKSASETCSIECKEELRRKNLAKFEQENKEKRKEYQRNRIKKKISQMSSEELKSYREKINEKSRENYAKRKEKS